MTGTKAVILILVQSDGKYFIELFIAGLHRGATVGFSIRYLCWMS